MEKIISEEDVSGDGNWHVVAFSTLILMLNTIRRVEQQMARLAEITALSSIGGR